MMDANFWVGKRVLVTGHSGFKGAWLTLWLGRLGAHVTGLALPPPTTPNLFERARVGAGIESHFGDIGDLATVEATLDAAKPDIVFHLAAQAIVRLSYDDPVSTYLTNVMGTVHVLEAARRTRSVKAVLVITSDKCYENPEWEWGCREHDPMGGHDPYSNSKGCAELVTSAYRRSFYVPGAKNSHHIGVATARAGNVIGGGDWARDRLIPDIVRATEAKQSVAIRNPSAVRPWQHVLEPLSGYLMLAEKLWGMPEKYAEGWNFGPVDEDALPVEEVVSRFCERLGRGAAWHVEKADNAPHEAHLLRLDIAKARTRLHWRPRWTIEQGISMTAAWYRAYLDNCDLRAVTLSQIEAFENTTDTNGYRLTSTSA